MSTDWGIGCLTCRAAGKEKDQYFTHEWNNCRYPDELWKLVRAMPEISAVHKKLGDMARFLWLEDADSCLAYSLGEFMVEHEGHELEPMNEYGAAAGDCDTYYECVCGWSHCCSKRAHGVDVPHDAGPNVEHKS